MNDTVAGIYANGIEPAYVLKRENPTEYYMDIANINKFRDNTVETDQIIGVYDLFESPHYLYLRLYKGDAIFIQRFDKKKQALVEYIMESSDQFSQLIVSAIGFSEKDYSIDSNINIKVLENEKYSLLNSEMYVQNYELLQCMNDA